MAEYTNVPRTLGTVISSGLATLHELDTVYGVEDMWNLLEVHTVNLHNRRVIEEREAKACQP